MGARPSQTNDIVRTRQLALRTWYLGKIQLQDKIVLDAGCGDGIAVPALLAEGCRKIFALDMDPTCEARVKESASHHDAARVEFVHGDIRNMGCFADCALDVVIMNYVLDPCELSEEDVRGLRSGLRECHRVLRSSGSMAVACDAPDDTHLDERYRRRFRLCEAVDALHGDGHDGHDYPEEWFLSEIAEAGFQVSHFARAVNADIQTGEHAIANIRQDMVNVGRLEEPLRSAFLASFQALINDFDENELVTQGYDNYQILAVKHGS